MSKTKKEYVVRGFNLSTEPDFDKPTGVIKDKDTFAEVTVNTQAEAVAEIFGHTDIGSMTTDYIIDNIYLSNVDEAEVRKSANMISVIDLKIELGTNDKYEVRSIKSALRDVLKHWAEKSRVKNLRGWRANAIKTPMFDYVSGNAVAKVQVILSNAIIYSSKAITPTVPTYTTFSEDIASLRKELKKQLGIKFSGLRYNHSKFGAGEVL